MPGTTTDRNDAKKRIDAVINYVLNNPNGDISLHALAAIAHYSPFHFQKLFKDTTGQSPKQYVIQLRLERAYHFLIIYPHKTIKEISLECRFSSPAVFTRSIHRYFGLSPEAIRQLNPQQRIHLFHETKHPSHPTLSTEPTHTHAPLKVVVQKIEALHGIHLITSFEDLDQVKKTFHTLRQTAISHDLFDSKAALLGILNPQQNTLYKAFIAVHPSHKIPTNLPQTTILAGKYASFSVTGTPADTLHAAHLFFQQWLPDNRYRIREATSFESFTQDPAIITYPQLERKFFVPIEPCD